MESRSKKPLSFSLIVTGCWRIMHVNSNNDVDHYRACSLFVGCLVICAIGFEKVSAQLAIDTLRFNELKTFITGNTAIFAL